MVNAFPKKYRIKWQDKELLYFPLEGIIFDTINNKKFKIRKTRKNNLFENPNWKTFRPICLTIYLGNKCNLDCTYCYIPEKKDIPALRFDTSSLFKAANFIAQNCLEKNMPFILGFHGGNEPLLYTDLIKEILTICKEISDYNQLPLHAYCTTNGVISQNTAKWASNTFYGITLSWDGPSEIHNKYRPHLRRISTEEQVTNSARIFSGTNSELKFFKVRATISSHSVNKMEEIVQYFHQHNIHQVDLFPVYQDIKKTVPIDLVPDPISFVRNFLKARSYGEQRGMKITYANTRIEDVHDKHCSLFQQNLTLTPDGYYTACFQATHNFQQQHAKYMYGRMVDDSLELGLNQQRGAFLYDELIKPYNQCRNCFNLHHCAKECPSICPLTTEETKKQSFDCRIEKWIGIANILQVAKIKIKDSEIENCEDFFSGFSITNDTPTEY